MPHTFHKSPHHYCGRCGTKSSMDDLQWQNGVLVCSKYGCRDKELIGARDMARVKAMEIGADKEGQPDEKLTQPSVNSVVDEIGFPL